MFTLLLKMRVELAAARHTFVTPCQIQIVRKRSTQTLYIGCATDSKFVEHTAVMLTSLSMNGDVREATILVAAFDLDAREKAILSAGADKMKRHLRFVDVNSSMLQGVGATTLEAYPPAALGRLMLAATIPEADARLITLDSDMIVNSSLRYLAEIDLGSAYLAAVHDPPRADDPFYFNSGMTVINVAAYRRDSVGPRCVRYVAEHRPFFADQDALNAVIGERWLRLSDQWNFFIVDGRAPTPEEYRQASIAHFPGWKPWDHSHHPGAQLYIHYRDLYRRRLALRSKLKSAHFQRAVNLIGG